MNQVYAVEDVKNEFVKSVIDQYAESYNRIQLDLAFYVLNDFCNNLAANGLVLLKVEQQVQQPVQQPVMQQQVQQPVQPMGPPPKSAAQPYGYPQQMPNANSVDPFEKAEYVDPRLQRQKMDEFSVQREVKELNAQLQPKVKAEVDVSLSGEKGKSFVDKIKEMRSSKKRDVINPEE